MPNLINNSLYHKSIAGAELVRRREALGLSQAELATKCGVSQGYISQIERPGRWEVRVRFADKLAEILL